jgi:drug/metabolite transporter (DMT)-like permease
VTWAILALGAAVTQGAQFAVVKGGARHIPPFVLIFWVQALGVTAWSAYFVVTGRPVAVPPAAWPWVAAAVALSGSMMSLLILASARGDISIVGPVLALSPAFAIVPDWVVSGTLPHGLGWVGLALSVTGTVMLGRAGGARLGLRALFARVDALAALGGAILLGVLTAVDRRNAMTLGVPSYLLALHGSVAVLCAVVVAVRSRRAFVATLPPRQLAIVLGHAALTVLGNNLLVAAMTLAPGAYVAAVRRTSAVFAVLLGRALFAEAGFGGRLAGAVVTCLGVALLVMAR